jgi:riboflavin biosynthesis pyrimidine reductase
MTNFVSTIDGVASYGIPNYAGGGTISKSAADRWMMDVWRTHADVILLGAETIRDADAEIKHMIRKNKLEVVIDGQSVDGFVDTVEDPDLAAWRTVQKKSRHPVLAVFSGSGDLPSDLGIFQFRKQSVIVFTAQAGKKNLEATSRLPHVTVVSLNGNRGDLPRFALDYLRRELSVNYVLAEGGPGTIGSFLKAELLDEILLTVAPRLGYGRDSRGKPRKHIFEGSVNFYPEEALADPEVAKPPSVQPSPEFELVSMRCYDNHAFFRYWKKRH